MTTIQLGPVTISRVVEIPRSTYPTASPAHFPVPGYVVRANGGFRFTPAPGATGGTA